MAGDIFPVYGSSGAEQEPEKENDCNLATRRRQRKRRVNAKVDGRGGCGQ
jgi:hypothetical protein